MKKRSVLSLLLLSSLCTVFLYSLEETIVLGKEDNWQGLLLGNCVLVEGREGFLDIILADNEYTADGSTDLLLHFNSSDEITDLPHYTPVVNNGSITHKAAFAGSGSGVFQHQKETLVLEGSRHSLFYPGVAWKDFSIEFWMYPATLEEGETILLWQGSRIHEREITHQELRVHVQGQRLVWEFENMFLPPDLSPFTVTVRGLTLLIPRRWAHHLLRFDSSTGLLEYTLNGEPEGIGYATRSGREDGTVYLPKLGENPESNLTVGSYFTGLLDELRVSSRFVDRPSLYKLGTQKGSFTTRAIDLGYTNTRVLAVEIDDNTPGDSDIFYYYRVSNNLLDLNLDRIPWVPFPSAGPFPGNVRGKYLQFYGELYPDGSQVHSPVLSNLAVTYEPDLPPLPPSGIRGEGGSNSITISWDPVPDEDISGYLLYYGEKPGVYFGQDAMEGASPVDVGNTRDFTLTGMENGKLYYFTLVSYDNADPPHYSEFGAEISVRPSKLGAAR
ncbi:MAG: fibronectin type III domain-containing protein [Spirochaetales bacterium]|nr:fibronectin type III domain-containing protein [Spirochaetales bacterium]